MLISEFARKTGLTTDTVRFYVRKGLLTPQRAGNGERNLYQVFTDEDVRAVKVIRTSQSLGLSLKDLVAIGEKRRAGRHTPEFSIGILSRQLGQLEAKAAELKAMTRYLRAKIAWLEGGEQGASPDFEKYAKSSVGAPRARKTAMTE